MNPLRRLGLLDRELPPDEQCPHGYTVNGVLPMLAQWVKDVAESAVYDWEITWRIIRQDHPLINGLLPGDVWEGR